MKRTIFAALLCLLLASPFAEAKGSKGHKTATTTSKKTNSKDIPCSDGTTSHPKHTQGACSHHGGIKK
jgi:hypothetical protein